MTSNATSIFSPDQAACAKFGLNSYKGDRKILWIGFPSNAALFICNLARLQIVVVFLDISVLIAAFNEFLQIGLTGRVLRFLYICPIILLSLVFVLFLSQAPRYFVYFLTTEGIGIKLRFRQGWLWRIHAGLRAFARICDANGEVFYPYRSVGIVIVRKWFFNIGNFDFQNFATDERELALRQDNQEIAARKETKDLNNSSEKSSPFQIIYRRTLFPGGNYGGTGYTKSSSMSAGMYGLSNISSVGKLLEKSIETA